MIRWTVAYIDPGTGGLILQFVLGGVAGLAALVRYRWSSIRRRFTASDAAPSESGDNS
jgi:hypothetical protein